MGVSYKKASVITTGLVGLAFLVGTCKKPIQESNNPKDLQDSVAYFDNWGFVENPPLYMSSPGGVNIIPYVSVQLGDLDNDGDLDVVALNKNGGIKIYENRIPKKQR